jgi:hypothetical protein
MIVLCMHLCELVKITGVRLGKGTALPVNISMRGMGWLLSTTGNYPCQKGIKDQPSQQETVPVKKGIKGQPSQQETVPVRNTVKWCAQHCCVCTLMLA